jgi:membrane protein involved in colicin uptake
MQAYSTVKKNRFTKKKLSPANENLKLLQDPQEGRIRKAEFKREKMMSSVKQLIEMQNTSGNSGGD